MKNEEIYKDCKIEPAIYGEGFEWYHPDTHDCDWDGDGWHTVGQGSAKTIEECKEEIDDYLNDL